MEVLEKLWEMSENIEILNLSQDKEEETIQYQNQINVHCRRCLNKFRYFKL